MYQKIGRKKIAPIQQSTNACLRDENLFSSLTCTYSVDAKEFFRLQSNIGFFPSDSPTYLSLKNCRKLKYGTYYYYYYYTHSHPMYHQAIVFSQCQLQKPLRLRHGRHLKKDIFAKKTFNFLVKVSDKAVTSHVDSYSYFLHLYLDRKNVGK